MIDYFAHLSLVEQLLADVSFPVVFGLLAYGKRGATALDYADEKISARFERNSFIAMGLGFIAMISLTIYCHISH